MMITRRFTRVYLSSPTSTHLNADMDYLGPKLVISKCIEFDSVRWYSQTVSGEFVRKLIPHVDPVTVCPEVEIGLGHEERSIKPVRVPHGELKGVVEFCSH